MNRPPPPSGQAAIGRTSPHMGHESAPGRPPYSGEHSAALRGGSNMTRATHARLRFVVGALAAQAFWAVPHQCADGSTVDGTLLVSSTRDFESPDTEDTDPTVRVQFLAVC